MTRPLAIAVGDAAGIGPAVSVEAIAKALGDDRAIVVGDAARLHRAFDAIGLEAVRYSASSPSRIAIVDVGALPDEVVEAHAADAATGAHSLQALDAAIDLVRTGEARAVVTGPVSKEAIVASGTPFVGQTEHLARRCGLADDEVTMLFLGPKLRVGLVTTHLAIVDAPSSVTAARVERTIRHLADALERLGPDGRRDASTALRIDVTGLNPHAGENGLFGDEEIRVVAPVCSRLREEPRFDGSTIRLVGPRAAEASFREAASGLVDGVVAMLHDQATIASKLLDWGDAVNVTWGLPFVRTSVDHGVAFDAARAGNAAADGMIAALRTATRLTRSA